MSSAKTQIMDTTNSPKAKPGTSRTSNLLPQSVIESMRKQAKANHQRGLEILANQAEELSLSHTDKSVAAQADDNADKT